MASEAVRAAPIRRFVHGIAGALRRLGLLKIAFRVYEKWKAISGRIAGPGRSGRAEGLPIPPADLRVLVAGTADVSWFLTFGKSMFEAVCGVLRRNGTDPSALRAVLEFGCGCGRVLRHWHCAGGPAVHGIDYNPKLIAWCEKHLPFAQFTVNHLHPPLPYPDGAFDLVYAISVFTHMSEELQLLWMRELRRVLRPGAHLLITTQGESCRDRLTGNELADFDSGRLAVRYEEASGMNLCSAYHPETYVREKLSAGYSVCDLAPGAAHGVLQQDLYLLKKADDPTAASWSSTRRTEARAGRCT